MIKIAVLGYGTIGSGVVEVLETIYFILPTLVKRKSMPMILLPCVNRKY